MFKYYLITHCNTYLYDKRTDKIRHNKETIIIHDTTLKFTPSKNRAKKKERKWIQFRWNIYRYLIVNMFGKIILLRRKRCVLWFRKIRGKPIQFWSFQENSNCILPFKYNSITNSSVAKWCVAVQCNSIFFRFFNRFHLIWL